MADNQPLVCIPRKNNNKKQNKKEFKQGVALTGRNRTGLPCSVSRPTTHMPGGGPPTGSVTDDGHRRQTPASKTILAH